MSEEIAHCPYTIGSRVCNLDPRYDTTAPADGAVDSISQSRLSTDDAKGFAAMLGAASGRIYRGEICLTCGAFFPAT